MGAQLQACGRICGRAEARASSAAARERALVCSDDSKVVHEDWQGRPTGTPVQDEGFICMGGPAPICPTGPAADWKGRPTGTPVQDEGFICMGGPAPICPTGPAGGWQGRVAGTPVQDEGFICMGGPAPLCPTGKILGPVTLSTLQGEWICSSGSTVCVVGTEVSINGLLLAHHKVELDDDGVVQSIGKLWQLDTRGDDGTIEFRASSTREGMESARLEIWSPKANATAGWSEKMKAMGYAGSAANPLGRGIDGCMPGTDGIEPGEGGYAEARDKRDVELLQALVTQWREPQTEKVLSKNVVPDFTNRSQTGLGVELLHYVAGSIADKGFQTRKGTQGHDIPVVVREPVGSDFHEEALRVWKTRVSEEEGFPRVRADRSSELFTSLGNGHFFQALNLFGTESRGINDGRVYKVGDDTALNVALTEGVPSIILKHQTPRAVRAKIAELLNSKREFHWTLSEDGQVDVSSATEDKAYCSQFEWLSKGMDAEQVNCLVRTHLGIKESKRITG